MNAAHLFPSRARPLSKGPWYALPLIVGVLLVMFAVIAGVWIAAAWALRAGVALAFSQATAGAASLGTYSQVVCAAITLGIVVLAPRKVGKRTNGVSKPNRFGLTLWQRGPFLLAGLMSLMQAIDGFRGVH